MRLNALLIALVTIGMSLAGCTGGDSPPTATDGPGGPQFTEETGAIDGLVLSDDLIPIKGAIVALASDLSDTRTTTADGRFSFGNLEPGEDSVLVSKIGYKDAQQRVQITAGQVITVEFRLPAQAAEGVPYRVTFGPVPGRFFCGFSVEGGVSGPCKIVAFTDPDHPVETTWSDVSNGEENIFPFPTAISGNKSLPDSDRLSSLLVEVTWEPVSASASILQMTVEDLPESGRNLSEPMYARSEGGDPLRLLVEPGVKHESVANHSRGTAMPLDQDGFLIGVFPGATESDPMTIMTSQNFEVWFTLAYNVALPEGYTALGDS